MAGKTTAQALPNDPEAAARYWRARAERAEEEVAGLRARERRLMPVHGEGRRWRTRRRDWLQLLVLLLIVLLVPTVVLWLAVMGDSLFNTDIGRTPQLHEMRTEESVSIPQLLQWTVVEAQSAGGDYALSGGVG